MVIGGRRDGCNRPPDIRGAGKSNVSNRRLTVAEFWEFLSFWPFRKSLSY